MRQLFCLCSLFLCTAARAQTNFSFDFSNNGQRVCLADASVSLSPPSVTIHLLDAASNTTQTTNIYRRHLYGTGADWVLMALNLPAGTTTWTDNAVAYGDVWEYQVKRIHGATFSAGYTGASVGYDQTNYRGRMILLVANNITVGLPARYTELKKDLTGDGWQVQELIVPRAYGWDSGDTVITIRQQIQNLYNAAPANDKPKELFILGHVPLPRSGQGGQTPDAHTQNAGARGADTYYADVDGIFTDIATYNPGGLSSPYAVNLPGDFKWDQDTIPSALEMGFGRIDFADITSYAQSELTLTDQYLARLHHYKQKDAGFDMGSKNAFFLGYDNSNDGSYRTLPSMSGENNVYQNTTALPHPQWVQQNGPFMMYMQNVAAPQIGQWNTYGMNAAIYSSDQSYWGFGDVPEGNQYSTIRAILGADSKCVMMIWTTMAINVFHQAGLGECMGASCKQIMDHNTTNQKIEKPSSPYDTPAFWNRTQFELYGDPTIRLFQVSPVSVPQIALSGSNILLQWSASPDNNIIGYHIYKSATEFGQYNKISGASAVAGTAFTDTDPHHGEWYMIRAIKQQATGSGIFFNPAQGIFIQNNITVVPVGLVDFTAVKEKQAAVLSWSTATEVNNTGFTVQRSSDVAHWADIATIQTKSVNGSSNGLLSYLYTDQQPVKGNNFYRLKFLPLSGLGTFSTTRRLIFDQQNVFSVTPNPVQDILKIISTGNAKIGSVQLFDFTGKILLEDKSGVDHINFEHYVSGIYILKIIAKDGNMFQEKILKQ